MIERQKSGKCLNCGSANHRVSSCPSRKPNYRSSTPRGTPRQRVNFRVATVQNITPTLGREGDDVDDVEEDTELAVDSYLEEYFGTDTKPDYGLESEDEA